MSDRTDIKRVPIVAIALMVCTAFAVAQDVALITAVKGAVTVKNVSGEAHRAAVKDGLLAGDEVTTGDGATASLMYFTGKEVILPPNKSYVVAKEAQEESFLSRLATVFSNLIWSKEKAKSVLGASRGFEPKVHAGILGVYPSFNLMRGPVLPFEWIDSRSKASKSYIVTLRNEKGTVEKSVTVTDANRLLLPIARLNLAPGVQYKWEVRDQNSKLASQEITFSFLPDAEKDNLEQSRRRLKDICKTDTTQFRYTLLEAMLYLDANLLMQAEASLSDLVKLRPDFAGGHEMLAEVYRKVGKIDAANEELKAVRALLKAQ